MALVATNRHINVVGLTITPFTGDTAGTPVVHDGITQLSYDRGGQNESFSGDGDRFPTTIVGVFEEPTISVNGANVSKLHSLTNGTYCTVAWKIPDARNGVAVGGGGFQFTTAAAAAVFKTSQTSHQHKTFATGSMNWDLRSLDGSTNPVSFTAL